MNNLNEYRKALKRERDRELKRNITRQGAFEHDFLHIDWEAPENEKSDSVRSWLSDGGTTAGKSISLIDKTLELEFRAEGEMSGEAAYDALRATLAIEAVKCRCHRLLRVLTLVLENESDAEASIMALSRECHLGYESAAAKYHRDLCNLIRFFEEIPIAAERSTRRRTFSDIRRSGR